MRNLIREKRRLNLNYKRITPDIIRRLAAIFDREIRDALQSNDTCFYIYTIDAADDSSYESQSTIIFNENEIVEKKVISKITMRFNIVDYSKSIELQLLHTEEDKNKENYLLVSGDDPIWVNGTMAQFAEIIASAETQPKYNKVIPVFSFLIGVAFIILYVRRVHYPLSKNYPDLAEWLFIAALFGAMALGFGLNNYLESQYPAIELQTGAKYLQISRKKRRAVSSVITLILLPLLLAFIYDIFKSFF